MTSAAMISLAGVVIACISLIVAVSTYWATQIKPASITFGVGPYVNVGYTVSGQLAFILPITFVNTSHSVGCVKRVVLTFEPPEPGMALMLRWSRFARLRSDAHSWYYDELAHVLAVPGRSHASTSAVFTADQVPQPYLRSGVCQVTVSVWTAGSTDPTNATFKTDLPEEVALDMEAKRRDKKASSQMLPIGDRFPKSQLIDAAQVEAMLGSTYVDDVTA